MQFLGQNVMYLPYNHTRFQQAKKGKVDVIPMGLVNALYMIKLELPLIQPPYLKRRNHVISGRILGITKM